VNRGDLWDDDITALFSAMGEKWREAQKEMGEVDR